MAIGMPTKPTRASSRSKVFWESMIMEELSIRNASLRSTGMLARDLSHPRAGMPVLRLQVAALAGVVQRAVGIFGQRDADRIQHPRVKLILVLQRIMLQHRDVFQVQQ